MASNRPAMLPANAGALATAAPGEEVEADALPLELELEPELEVVGRGGRRPVVKPVPRETPEPEAKALGFEELASL